MLYMSHLFSAASGKLSGLVASRNRGGPYVRAYTVPTDPNTTEQQNCRAAMSALSTAWAATLTDNQRAQWSQLAAMSELPNRLGQPHRTLGRQLFTRQNFRRQQINQAFAVDYPIIENPPETIARAPSYTPTIALESGDPPDLTFTWPDTPDWFGQENTLLSVYLSDIRPATTNRYFGPWTLFNRINGGDSPSNPYVFSLGATPAPASGERMFVRTVLSWNTGEVSQAAETFVAGL